MEHIEPEARFISRWGRSDETLSSKTEFGPGDVLFGKLRPYLKKVALATSRGVCSTEIIVLRPRNNAMTPEFLYCLCSSPALRAYAVNHSAGTRMPRVSPKELLKAPVLVPPPAEQRRISDLMAAIDGALSKLATTEEEAGRMLAAARDKSLAEAELYRLGDFLEGIDAGRSPRCEERTPSPGEVGVIKVSAVRFNGFDPAEAKVLPPTANYDPSHLIRQGDVLMTRANGSLHLVGAACRVDRDVGNLLLCDKTLRLRPDSAKLDRDFLLHFLLSSSAREQIERDATGSSGQKNISQGQIKTLRLPIPRLEVQRQIVLTLEAMSVELKARQTQITRLRKLRAAMLGSLLQGHRIIPDSYDRFLTNGRPPDASLEPATA